MKDQWIIQLKENKMSHKLKKSEVEEDKSIDLIRTTI